jgi:uncharacterized membrane protein YcaP (DUF421 family)
MNSFYEFVGPLLGLGVEPKDLSVSQVSSRGVIVFLATLVMVRLSKKRSLAEKTAFEAILLVIVASVLSRAINGTAAFFASIGGGFALVILHRVFGWIGCHSHAFGKLIKGCPDVIVENGKPILQVMRRNHISEHDLEEDLRLNAKMEDLSKVRVARIERSGDISFIKKEASS